MRKSMKALMGAAVAAALSMATVASASTITANYVGASDGGTATISGADNGTFYAGGYRWHRNATFDSQNNNLLATGVPALNQTFDTFCVDLKQTMATGQDYVFNIVALEDAPASPGVGAMTHDQAQFIRDLWGRHRGEIFNTAGNGLINNQANAVAFQIAVWEIITDGSLIVGGANDGMLYYSFSGGSLKTTAASDGALAIAIGWLNALNLNNDAFYISKASNLQAMVSDKVQDQILAFTDQGQEVPLPASVWGGLLMLSGLAAAKWQSRRKSAE